MKLKSYEALFLITLYFQMVDAILTGSPQSSTRCNDVEFRYYDPKLMHSTGREYVKQPIAMNMLNSLLLYFNICSSFKELLNLNRNIKFLDPNVHAVIHHRML